MLFPLDRKDVTLRRLAYPLLTWVLVALADSPALSQQTILTGAETLRGIDRRVGLVVDVNRETPVSAEEVRDTVVKLLRSGGFTILGDDPNDASNYPLVRLSIDTSIYTRGGARQWISTYLFTFRQRLISPARQNVRFAAPTYVTIGWTYVGALQWNTILEATHEYTSTFISEFDDVNPRPARQRPPVAPPAPRTDTVTRPTPQTEAEPTGGRPAPRPQPRPEARPEARPAPRPAHRP